MGFRRVALWLALSAKWYPRNKGDTLATLHRPSAAGCQLDKEKIWGANLQSAQYERGRWSIHKGPREHNKKRRCVSFLEHWWVAWPNSGSFALEEYCWACWAKIHQNYWQLHRLQLKLQTLLHHQTLQPQVHTRSHGQNHGHQLHCHPHGSQRPAPQCGCILREAREGKAAKGVSPSDEWKPQEAEIEIRRVAEIFELVKWQSARQRTTHHDSWVNEEGVDWNRPRHLEGRGDCAGNLNGQTILYSSSKKGSSSLLCHVRSIQHQSDVLIQLSLLSHCLQ